MSKKPLIRNFVNYSSDNKNQKENTWPYRSFPFKIFMVFVEKHLLNIDNTKVITMKVH